jgi:tRNA uridine 5-carboxymethylaminomethyl modification enzyme
MADGPAGTLQLLVCCSSCAGVPTVTRTLVPLASGERLPASQALRQPELRLSPPLVASGQVERDLAAGTEPLDVASAETELKYEGYLRRQEADVARSCREGARPIPPGFAYRVVPGLSREIVERLSTIQPPTLGHALRVPGVTPAAVAVIATYVGRLSHA